MPEQYQPYDPSTYQNPSQPSNLNPTFGTGGQFNIPTGAITPFNFGQQREEDVGFTEGFTEFLGGQETLPAIQDRLETRFGIPDLQEDYQRQREAQAMVGSQIRGLPESVNQRTNESMITQSQMNRIVNKEVKDLLEVYNGLGEITAQTGQRLSTAEKNLNNAAKLEMAQMQKDMTPWLMQYEMKNIMQASEFSGWGTVQKLEINRLIGNRNAGFSWSNSEAQRANALAIQEKSFANQLNLLEKQSELVLDLWG